jgi:hypothetical protein
MAIFVAMTEVRAMLIHCADGFEATITTHSIMIKYGTGSYMLPRGEVRPKSFAPKHISGIQAKQGQVKKLVQALGIGLDCAKRMIPQIQWPAVPQPVEE